jgi:hypothetical protein
MGGKAGAGAGAAGGKAGAPAEKGGASKLQYLGPDQELATMLERDIIDQGINIT